MKKKNVKIGLRVLLKESSEFVGVGCSNPLGVEGTVIEINDDNSLNVRVEWDNDIRNAYNARDIKKVKT